MNNLSAACLEPYIGLKPFTEQEKDRFFGRARETSILLDKIRANRQTLLLAASGVGKSSLLQAGIMPTFRADGHAELIYHNSWAAEPGAALRQSILNHYANRPGLSGFGGDFTQLSLKDTLLACTLFGSGQQILLLDQFEEFFNYQRFQKGFKAFVEELSAAVLDRSLPACFVFSMREDFALELNAFKPFLPGVFDSYFRLEKLTRDQARLAIKQPLQQIGWSFAPKQDSKEGLLEQVLDDLAKREQERQFGVQELLALQELPLLVEPPHLQIVCRELWDNHRDEAVKQITHAAYHKAGRAEGILETYFLRKIGQFSKKEQVLASAAFDHLVGQRATKVAHPLERLAELTRADANALKLVLDKLQDCAVLRRQKRGEEFWYELYHDIFSESIDKWNREFKHRQRVKRLTVGTAAVLIAGGLLFAGNNWRANYYGRYLQLSSKDSLSERIEVCQGTATGWDMFHHQRFLHETPFSRSEIEADKKFDRRIIEDKSSSQLDLIGKVPLVARIPLYMETGLYTKGRELAEAVLKDGKAENMKLLPTQIASARTAESVELLLKAFGKDKKEIFCGALAQLGEKAVLIKFLTDANTDLRLNAAYALGNLGDSSVAPEFVKLLDDKDASVRRTAVSALGNLGDSSVVPVFVKLLDDKDASVRRVAVSALDRLGYSSISPELVKLLADKNNDVRKYAAYALGNIGDSSVAPALVKLLADTDILVQHVAEEALGKLGDYSAVPAFIKKDTSMRQSAVAGVLNNLNNSSITPELVELLADKDASVRHSAVEALDKLGDSSVVPELVKLLADKDATVRQAAAEALGNLGDSSVVPELVKLLADENAAVRLNAVYARSELGDISIVPELVKLLADKEEFVRRTAAAALGKLGDSSVAPELIKLLADEEEFVRMDAAEALGKLSDSSVALELIKLLADNNVYVRLNAAEALGKLGDSSVTPELIKLLADKIPSAASALGTLKADAAAPILSGYLKDENLRDVVAKTLIRMNVSSPEILNWQEKQFKAAQKQLNRKKKQEAAAALGSVFTEESVALLSSLLQDTNEHVIRAAAESIGNIGEYHPDLGQTQAVQLLKLLAHPNLNVRRTAIAALGQLISFHGKETPADLPDMDKDIHAALRSILFDPQEKFNIRLTAIDALGDTGRDECAQFLFELLPAFDRSKEEALHSRCLFWLGRMNHAPARDYVEKELRKLEQAKAEWRKQRDQNSGSIADKADAWWQVREYRLGSALARLAPDERGISLLGHPLHYVRQGAVRALAGKADADLIGKIIQAHQAFDPDDLPSPFPYTAFQAIDLSLWNLEYTGTENDLKILQNILANLKPCQIPGQKGAIKERLEWTIKRLEEKNADTTAAKFNQQTTDGRHHYSDTSANSH